MYIMSFDKTWNILKICSTVPPLDHICPSRFSDFSRFSEADLIVLDQIWGPPKTIFFGRNCLKRIYRFLVTFANDWHPWAKPPWLPLMRHLTEFAVFQLWRLGGKLEIFPTSQPLLFSLTDKHRLTRRSSCCIQKKKATQILTTKEPIPSPGFFANLTFFAAHFWQSCIDWFEGILGPLWPSCFSDNSVMKNKANKAWRGLCSGGKVQSQIVHHGEAGALASLMRMAKGISEFRHSSSIFSSSREKAFNILGKQRSSLKPS